VPIIIEPCWIEAHRGIFQKRPYNEFLEEWSKFDLSYDYVPPKGESVNQLRKRIVKGLDNVINSNDEEVLCITHGGLISNALMMLYDFEFEQALPTQTEMAVLIQDKDHFILDSKLNSFLKINQKYEVSIKKIYDYQ
jgi:broad specificity phosphatase PhoE